MAFESLQAVVGTAVVDPSFRRALLNDSRRRAISSFNLTHEEEDAVMRIHADSLEAFAGQLDRWISQAKGQTEPCSLALPARRR